MMVDQDELILLETELQAWANQGWVSPGLVNQTHIHLCTGCREEVSCLCNDPIARWTTCFRCEEAA